MELDVGVGGSGRGVLVRGIKGMGGRRISRVVVRERGVIHCWGSGRGRGGRRGGRGRGRGPEEEIVGVVVTGGEVSTMSLFVIENPVV